MSIRDGDGEYVRERVSLVKGVTSILFYTLYGSTEKPKRDE